MSGVLVVPPIAHGLVGRTDLPIPAWLFGWGAAVVLVAVVRARWPCCGRSRAWRVRASGASCTCPRGWRSRAALIGIALFVLVVYAGFEGAQVDDREPQRRPSSTCCSGSGCCRCRCCSATCSRSSTRGAPSAARPAGSSSRLAGDALPEPMAYPEKLGRWPAAIGILCFAWLELVSHEPLGPVDARGPHPGLRRGPARRDEPLRGRRSGSATATRSPSTSTSSPACRRCAGSAGRSTCARCCPA